MGADGLPYTLMRRIIEEKGYDWVALTSGLGHLNMNQLKTFFNVASSVCFDVCLNFKTLKALSFFLSCKDTHKSWQAFEIFLHGTILEIFKLYADTTTTPSSTIGFLK